MTAEWKRFQLLAKSWGSKTAVIDSHHSPSENDFAVHDFVKIFRINPAVIDGRYRNDARHSGLRLAKSDKQLYFLISWALFLR
jgi:hypothetical protein